eukprot:scaffold2129_cov255-Pinguiococcus_pyrenoidosus.AAC.8
MAMLRALSEAISSAQWQKHGGIITNTTTLSPSPGPEKRNTVRKIRDCCCLDDDLNPSLSRAWKSWILRNMNFISTSVLKSEDGISFNKEEQIESEEAARAKAANSLPSKPLYEQLAEQEAKKQEEYDAITRQLYAAPKALDEEVRQPRNPSFPALFDMWRRRTLQDVEHLDAIAERQRKKESQKRAEEEAALSAFGKMLCQWCQVLSWRLTAFVRSIAAAQRSHAESLSANADAEVTLDKDGDTSREERRKETVKKSAVALPVTVKVKRRKVEKETGTETSSRTKPRKKVKRTPALLVDYGDSDEESDDG